MRFKIPTLVAILVAAAVAQAPAEGLEAGGVHFEPKISVTANEAEHELRCTGTALRKKWFFKVYAIAAYLDTATEAGEDLGGTYVSANVPKRVHLQMLRDVESHKIVDSINEALDKCSTLPMDEMTAERERFMQAFSMEKLTKGQDIRFTWMPGSGLQISVDHQILDTIESADFAHSFFEIYFGPHPVNDGMKEDLLQLEG